MNVCLYFQIHQPFRTVQHYTVFDIGKKHKYFDSKLNHEVAQKVAQNCYIPTTKLLIEYAKKNPNFRVTFSISGTALEQFALYTPEVLDLFVQLYKTGCAEFLAETYYHSLSCLYSSEEFEQQTKEQMEFLHKTIGCAKPTTFRNTELLYNDDIAKRVHQMGFSGMLIEGADQTLENKSPNFVYQSSAAPIKLLTKNYRLSDDIAFRFSKKNWSEYPLTPTKYVGWLEKEEGDAINLFMDYETFGEHHSHDSKILTFLQGFLEQWGEKHQFISVSDALKKKPKAELTVEKTTSWADLERDASAWIGNALQESTSKELYKLERQIKQTNDMELIETWKKLTTSDHFYYMCTKWCEDGVIHHYFSPHESPYDAFITLMNIINDMKLQVKKETLV